MRGIVGRMGRDALTGNDREMPFSGRGVVGRYGGKQRWRPVLASSRLKPLPQGFVQTSKASAPVRNHRYGAELKAGAILVGGLPAITGVAGAIHRVACFAGLPAPTATALVLSSRCTCGSGFRREEASTGYYRTTVRLALRNTRRSM